MKTLELLTSLSPTGTPVGECDICHETGPLKHKRRKGASLFHCIPCEIDGMVSA